MAHKLKVKVDRDLCMGSGNCARLAPGTFELDDENISVVTDPSATDAERLRQAERNCPTSSITVTEASGADGA